MTSPRHGAPRALLALIATALVLSPAPLLAEEPYNGATSDTGRVALGAGFALVGVTSFSLGLRYGLQNRARAEADEIDQLTAHRDAGRADILLVGGALATAMGTSLIIYELRKPSLTSSSRASRSQPNHVWISASARGVRIGVSFR